MAASTNTAPRTYGNWQKPPSAGVLGLGFLGTLMLLFGLVIVIIVMAAKGIVTAGITAAVMSIFLLAILKKDKHGRNALARLGAAGAHATAMSNKSSVYRSGPVSSIPWGTFQLPGILAQSRLSEHRDSYGRPFALLYVPMTTSYTVVLGSEPDGAALVDQDQVDAWVADWGQWLASLGDEPSVIGAAVTIETAPDSGSRLRTEIGSHMAAHSPEYAQQMMREIMTDYPSGSSAVQAYVSVTFSGKVNGKTRKPEEMALDLAARLGGMMAGLESTGAGAVHLVTAQELCEVVRTAYDPASAELFDQARAAGEQVELRWPDVGPTASEARWDGYRHDLAYSQTWAMTLPPRGIVQSSILTRLLQPSEKVARKRVTLLYRPIDAARAASIVEADVAATGFRASSKSRPDARALVAAKAAARTAQEEASGAGLVEFGMLVTATSTDLDATKEAAAAIDNLTAAARLQMRLLTGSQDSAFAACLPVGLVLGRHARIPAMLRNQL